MLYTTTDASALCVSQVLKVCMHNYTLPPYCPSWVRGRRRGDQRERGWPAGAQLATLNFPLWELGPALNQPCWTDGCHHRKRVQSMEILRSVSVCVSVVLTR